MKISLFSLDEFFFLCDKKQSLFKIHLKCYKIRKCYNNLENCYFEYLHLVFLWHLIVDSAAIDHQKWDLP